MHRLWLGKIYPWAGEYRQVNMEKDGFPFAPANQVSRLMRELERGALRRFTPCRSDDPGDPARLALEGEFGVPFHSAAIDPEVLDWSLGAGESAVLSAARSMGAVAILDDQDARIAARWLGGRCKHPY